MKNLLYHNHFVYRGTRHLVFFVCTVLVFACILFFQNGDHSFIQTLGITALNGIFFFGYAYITIFLLIPEFLVKRKAQWFIVLFLLVGIALSALKLVSSDYIFYSFISPENIERSGNMHLRYIVVNTKDMTFIVALFCISKYIKDYLYTESLRKKLEVQNRNAQSKLLRSQFDPHFMFNTINNLYALSLLNPLETTEVITRMKTVLSYIIDESEKELVELDQEINLVDNYIRLEQLRYGKRLKVSVGTNGKLQGTFIPPMLLFVLVENSFKHGISLDAGSPWINILVNSEEDKIILMTENSKPNLEGAADKDFEKGPGFSSLKKRLDIIYGASAYKLRIDSNKKQFNVRLELDKTIESKQNTYR